jgi:hypothetical protein
MSRLQIRVEGGRVQGLEACGSKALRTSIRPSTATCLDVQNRQGVVRVQLFT